MKVRGKVCGAAEIAAHFDVHPVTVTEWARKGCPYLKRGGKGIEWQFDSAAVSDWLIQRALRQAGIGDPLNDRSSLSLRKLKADTELAETKRDRFMSQHIPADMFVEAIKAVNAGVDEQLNSIAKEAAPLVAKETSLQACHRILERAVNNARRKIVSPEARASLLKRLGVK